MARKQKPGREAKKPRAPVSRGRMPVGGIRADIAKLAHCNSWDIIEGLYYEDVVRRCVQCGCHFTFSAREQQHWYETLKFHIHSVAVRCKPCRRLRRNEKALHARIGELAAAPETAASRLAEAEARVLYHRRFDKGDLAKAIAAARAAMALDPRLIAALYWEAQAHAAAGREQRATEQLQAFLERADASPGRRRRAGLARLIEQAREAVAAT